MKQGGWAYAHPPNTFGHMNRSLTPNWRDGQPGKIVLLDDGSATLCKSRTTYTDARGRKRDFITLEHARGWVPGTKYLTARPADQSSWVEEEARKSRTKDLVALVAALKIQKGRLDEPDYEMLGIVYRPDQQQPALTVKRLLKQERVKHMVREEMANLLSRNGITAQRVIRNLERIREKALRSGRLGEALKVLNTYTRLLGMI